MAMAMLFALMGPASAEVLDRTPDSGFADANCPVTSATPTDGAVGGWTKVDAPNGKPAFTGDFGSISSSGSTVTYALTPGYVMDICIKSGNEESGGGSVTYQVTGSGTLDAPGTPPKTVSHLSYRVFSRFTPEGSIAVTKTAAGAYETPVSWDLAKKVDTSSFSGAPGSVFTPTWTVDATKTVGASTGFTVTGTITVTNSSNMTATLDVSDSMAGAVIDCDAATAGDQTTVTLAPAAARGCAYSVSQTDASARTNTATATATSTVPAGHQAFLGTVSSDPTTIAWTETRTGDQSVTLADPRFSFTQVITETTQKTFTDNLSCPTDLTVYTDRQYTLDVTNTATLQGDVTDLERSASVVVTCRIPEVWKGETATGRGTDWAKSSNWFMFSHHAEMSAPGGIDLVAGQHHDAGQITSTRNGTTSITITLADGFRFASVSNNVKIQPLTSCDGKQSYVQPGQYSIKRTASGSSLTVAGLANTACYAIHVDVERQIS